MTRAADQVSVPESSTQTQKSTCQSNSSPSDSRPSGVFLMTNSFETGGSERQFVTLAKALDPRAFRVELGCIQKRGPFLEGLGEVSKFGLGGSLYGIKSVRSRWQLVRHLRRGNIAIAHAFDFYTNLTLIPAALLARVPVVIGSQRQLGDLLRPAQFRAQLAVLRWCDAIVCNSQAAADILIQHRLPKQKTVVIGNALPSEAFGEHLPALPPVPGVIHVGMIGRMNTPSKNHAQFLRAVARVLPDFPNLEAVLVGDGPLRPDLERQAVDLGLTSHTHFLGDRQDIPAILASLDVSVSPSSSESLSNVLLESMAAGVPVIASRVGGNPELVDDDRGILVPVNDDQALAAAIKRLLEEPALRTKLRHNARRFAKSNFVIERIRDQYQGLYSELLDRKRYRGRSCSVPSTLMSKSMPLRIVIVAASSRYVGGQSVQADLLGCHWQNDAAIETRQIPIDPVFPAPIRWTESIPVLRTLVRQPFYVASLWRNLKHADIVHIFSASYWSFLIASAPAWLIARMRHKKTLIHYHSGEARDHLLHSPLAKRILAKADVLVVPSGYLADVFREFGLGARIVPNIFDPAQFTFRIRSPLLPHLVCTRGFHPYYCVDVVVRAFAEVKREFPDACLDLVGSGPQEADIRKLVHTLNLRDVHFTGVASRQQIGAYYDRADIFINASRLDNMPVSIIEAFASGLPVVTTAPEGIRYVVTHEETGLLSEPGDVGALAQNVMRLLRDPALSSRLIANAYQQSSHYRWEAVRQQWLQIYRSLACEDTKHAQVSMVSPGGQE
jgi:L-malate glycosyltransferase